MAHQRGSVLVDPIGILDDVTKRDQGRVADAPA